MAGPAERAGDVVGGDRAAGERGEALGETLLVVGGQLVDAVVGRGRDRPVGGQDAQVGQRAHPGQRGEEVAERLVGRWHGEADRRRDRRQHVVAGEEHALGAVGEDEVTRGVAGRVHGLDRAVTDGDGVVAVHPAGGVLPVLLGRHLVVTATRRPLLRDVQRPRGAQHRQERALGDLLDVVEQVERRLLPAAQRHLGTHLVAQDGGHRVVVAVHVGHQEPADVGEARTDLTEALLEQLARHRDRPATVHQGQPRVGLQDVDVDRLETVHRQRQRDAPQPRRHLPRTLRGPVLPGVRRDGVGGGGVRQAHPATLGHLFTTAATGHAETSGKPRSSVGCWMPPSISSSLPVRYCPAREDR